MPAAGHPASLAATDARDVGLSMEGE